MNIQYCSDLHLEFLDNRKWLLDNPIVAKGDILILAGDIVLFKEMHQHQKFFDYVSKHFKHTFWIPGNHEYYNSDISKRSGSFEEQIRDNVTLLNNTVKTIDGVRFVFSTLWSHISPDKQFIIQQSLSDFRVIRKDEKRLTVDDYNQIHAESRLFLEEALKNKTDIPTVAITHHPPTFVNYPEKYANSTINEAFGTEMFNFIEESEIDYWIYGHHHCNISDFTVGKTKLVTNQLGYIKYNENENFRRDAVFSI
ncbi:metallophosphoesterase [Flavobacterium granuli]|uniref:Phosphohydrolase n=1 Tax=Flavobacterium granuli TaxID=280093 RepID=A0ABU1S715_9FLAO|nr:metallophosphoesterase [Flavobacterium granuli]MDR6846811.1 putative phosphohydrolase [Flavobacterium granuli]